MRTLTECELAALLTIKLICYQ